MLNMNQKVHHSQGNIPFSWEKKPGVSKDEALNNSCNTYDTELAYDQTKLSFTQSFRPKIFKDSQVCDTQLLPLPPCGVLPHQGNGHKKGLKKKDDPFFTAYMECTKVPKKVILANSFSKYPKNSEYDKTKRSYKLASQTKMVKDHDFVHDIPFLPFPPPGTLQKSASRKGLNKQDDLFFTAYKECAKSGDKGKWNGSSKDDGTEFGIRKNMSIFSCKASCSVMEDSMVMMISKNSTSKMQKEKG